jgi:hypothetical protein
MRRPVPRGARAICDVCPNRWGGVLVVLAELLPAMSCGRVDVAQCTCPGLECMVLGGNVVPVDETARGHAGAVLCA